MKKILLFLLLFPFIGWTQGWATRDHATRTYNDSTGWYHIEFDYDTRFATAPLTYPQGQPHYQAIISVYHIIEMRDSLLCQPFDGKYTEKGCFEDDPASLVAQAKERGLKEYAESFWVPEYTEGMNDLEKYFWEKGNTVVDTNTIVIDTADYSLKKLDLKGIYRCDTILIKRPPFDTIPCIMLVCDTNSMYINTYIEFATDTGRLIRDTTYGNFNLMVWWQKGYSVGEKTYYWSSPNGDGFTSDLAVRKERFTNLYYLDFDKQRLSENIIVWFSK
jgi:hypothetical protein